MRSILIAAGLGVALMNFAFAADDTPKIPNIDMQAVVAKLKALKECLGKGNEDAIKQCLNDLKAGQGADMQPII